MLDSQPLHLDFGIDFLERECRGLGCALLDLKPHSLGGRRGYAQHASRPMLATDLANSVRAMIDPRRNGPHYLKTRLLQLTGTCVGGFRLTRQDVGGAPAYSLVPLAEANAPKIGVGALSTSDDLLLPASCAVPLVPEESGSLQPAAGGHARRQSGLALEYGRGRIRIDTDFDPATLVQILGVLDQSR